MKCIIVGYKGLIGEEITKRINCEWVGVEKEDNIFYVKEKIDFIIHLASNCIIREVIKSPALGFLNSIINYQVLEYARLNNIKKVIYFSSSRVLHKERNPYTASKIQGEELCKAYKDCYGIDYLIIRPETVWSNNDKHERVITNWINRAKNNEDIIVYGDERKELSPIHVETFVEEYLKAQEEFLNDSRSYSFNLSGSVRKVKDIINIIKNRYNSNSKVIYKEQELAQPQQSEKENIKRINDFEEKLWK